MFGSGKKTGIQSTIDTLIGAKSRFAGDLYFEGGLRIDGEVQGNIQAMGEKPAMLVISEQASVTGMVSAAHIIVNGTVNGPIQATQLLELQPKAKISGDVSYASLEMHSGAVVEGRLHHADLCEVNKPDLKVVAGNTN
jgi:cytoskeletal protein CcmA (bactofilin family)